MLSKKKKVIILASMLVLLVATGWLNIALNQPDSVDAGGNVLTGNFFVDSKANRLATRNNTVAILDEIISNPLSDEATVEEANRQKLAITTAMSLENDLEILINAREGVEDCIVTMSGNNINVIVKAPDFDDTTLSAIYNIIKSETGKTARYVNITPIE